MQTGWGFILFSPFLTKFLWKSHLQNSTFKNNTSRRTTKIYKRAVTCCTNIASSIV